MSRELVSQEEKERRGRRGEEGLWLGGEREEGGVAGRGRGREGVAGRRVLLDGERGMRREGCRSPTIKRFPKFK